MTTKLLTILLLTRYRGPRDLDIYFENGKATSSDSGALSSKRQGDLNKGERQRRRTF